MLDIIMRLKRLYALLEIIRRLLRALDEILSRLREADLIYKI